MTKGDLVSINVPRRKPRTGRIVGESRDKVCWSIILDGTNTPQTISKNFCSATTDASTKGDGK